MPLKGTMRKGGKTRRTIPGRSRKTVKITQKVRVPMMKPTTKAGITDLVKTLLGRKTENKAVGWKVEDSVSHNSPIGAADCYPLVQQIGQLDVSGGINSAVQRIGDKIQPKSLRVKGVVSIKTDQNTIQNLYVRVLILAQKDIKVGSQVSGGSVNANALLRPMFNTAAGADQAAFGGTTQNLLQPVNTDLFRVYYDKIHKVCPASNATVENVMGSFRWGYDFKQLPANLTYDEGNGDWANNFAPFIALGYAYADGTAPDTATTRIVSNTYSLLTFEDA